MKNLTFTSLIVLVLISTAFAERRGASGAGNGGDAIVCFSIPAGFAVKNDKLTEDGKKSIISVTPFEAWLLQKDADLKENPFKKGPFSKEEFVKEHFLDRIHESSMVRLYYAFMLSPIEEGTPRPKGLPNIKDGNESLDYGPHCANIQLVIRYGQELHYDSFLWSYLTSGEKELIQWHEEIYHLGYEFFGHKNSRNTHSLLIDLLTGEFPIEDVLWEHQFHW